MYTKSFNTKKTWLGAVFTLALVAIMGLTFAFKPSNSPTTEHKRASDYFRYTGPAGSENDKTLWVLVSPEDLPECEGVNDGCTIEVDQTYTSPSGATRVLNSNVAVTSGAHKNPIVDHTIILGATYKNP
ncbi:hypothetical protein [Pedobacter psychrodurus]|uniref:hypothetical protein n=1 Tax=Pedobacter psychrodurus TaxID=2530456 RepID=UPI001206D122|nr:hypothetical protein [Pedobacter psychrodurus]RZJ92626.1 MAG: hypothetical protein EOO20_01135 [Chryseobacterium sp.]